MKVTPRNKKFGRYAPGDVFELKDRTAKLLIKMGKLERAEEIPAGDLAVVEPEVTKPEPVLEVVEETAPESAAEPDAVEADASELATESPTPEASALEPEMQQKVLTSAEPAAAPASKRQYQRRDMTAEGGKSAPAKKATKKAVTKRAGKKA